MSSPLYKQSHKDAMISFHGVTKGRFKPCIGKVPVFLLSETMGVSHCNSC